MSCYGSNEVPERCHVKEAMCAIPALQQWRWEICPGQTVGPDTGLTAQKEVYILATHS